MKTKRLKELITGLNNLEWDKDLSSLYLHLTELDYLLYKYRDKNEYIQDIIDNITKLYLEPNYIKRRNIFNLVKALCNILNKYIL